MRALLIINPKAGRKKASPIPAIQKSFQSKPEIELEIYETTGPGDATIAAKRAADEGYEIVVAAGGDGSIFEVSNGLVGTESSLGVIPIGTENVLAREMGIPLDPAMACQHLLQARTRRIDTGKLDDQTFVCFAGIGFDAHVAHRLPPARKKRFGALAYFFTSAEQISGYKKAPHQAKLTMDGEVLEAEFLILVVSNIRSYGGGLIPAPKARVDDGLLDVCVFPQANYLKIMQQLAAASKGAHLDLPGVGYYQCKDILIETMGDEQIQLDGDAWPGNSPFRIQAVPDSLLIRF